MTSNLQDRTYLSTRHHLSQHQIDNWIGKGPNEDFIQEKLLYLNKVKLFLKITDKLREKNIAFTCIKGPLLSLRIYNDPSIRFFHDVDLLIRLDDLTEAIQAMNEDGFLFAKNMVWPESKIRQELIVNSSHHLSLFNREQGFYVELHWTLMINLPISKQKIKELITKNLTTIVFAGREFTVFNKELELLYLMIHGAKHRWARLKWLIDINNYPLEDLNLTHFLELSKQLKADRIINQTDYLLKKYFNAHLPFAFGKRVPAFFNKYALKAIDEEIRENYSLKEILLILRYNLLLFPDNSYKIKTIKELLISQNDVINHQFSFKIVYLMYRPYSFLKRKIKVC